MVVSETILPTTSSSNNDRIVHLTKFLGTRGVTNNEAEYHGMLVALEEAHKQVQAFSKDHSSSCEACIKIHGDSNLIIQQMQGKYQVKSEKLMPLHRQAKQQIASMKKLMDTQIDFAHVYRADNTIADGELSCVFCVCVCMHTCTLAPMTDNRVSLTHACFCFFSPCEQRHGLAYLVQYADFK